MKAALAGIELHYLVQEFQELLGGRLETIYQPEPDDFYFVFYIPSRGKRIIRLVIGKCCYLTGEKPSGITPAPFCLFLRKHLEGAKLTGIEQLEGERILKLSFDRDGKSSLYVELFGKGNLILCDALSSIRGALHYQKFKGRDIVPKAKYQYPRLKIDPYSCSPQDVGHLLKESSLSLVKSLAAEVGLGGVYAEEACLRAGIEKNSLPGSLVDGQIKKIAAVLKEMTSAQLQPHLICKGQEILAASPFSLEIFKGDDSKPFPSLSGAMEEFFKHAQPEVKKQSSSEKERDRLVRLLLIQEENLAGLKVKEQEERSKGDLLFSHYQDIQSLLQELQGLAKEKGWKEVESVASANKIVRHINLKDKTIALELD